MSNSPRSKPLRKCPNCAAYFHKQIKGVTGLPSCPLCRQRLPETRQQPKGPKRTNKTSWTRKRVRRLMARDGTACWICGIELTIDTATLDHIIPRSKGGTFALHNLRLACSPCNNKRGNSDVIGLRRTP